MVRNMTYKEIWQYKEKDYLQCKCFVKSIPLTQNADRTINGWNIYNITICICFPCQSKRHFCKKMASWLITKNGIPCTTVRSDNRRMLARRLARVFTIDAPGEYYKSVDNYHFDHAIICLLLISLRWTIRATYWRLRMVRFLRWYHVSHRPRDRLFFIRMSYSNCIYTYIVLQVS